MRARFLLDVDFCPLGFISSFSFCLCSHSSILMFTLCQGSEFVSGFHAANDNRLAEVHLKEYCQVFCIHLLTAVMVEYLLVLLSCRCWGCLKETNGAYVTVVASWLDISLLTRARISSMGEFVSQVMH
ncbi:hypothetical protein L6452_40764 [Arctium lappa]|uniref:Uncharacterized protein n=1 Tax=Arctium lappa TaxID=4217 RepID=A0ACB8XPJ5_ARCLA|nr:hypothetical protein L6452_40764 [Arctium lappa]